MKRYYVLLLLFSPLAHAEEWLCKEESSQRSGSVISSCGVGLGKDENAARSQAFEHAKEEFLRICSTSDDCKNHAITAEPKRTTCERTEDQYKCYRLVRFVIGREIGPIEKSVPRFQSLHESKEEFKPFVYQENDGHPKLHKGLKRSDVLRLFGQPYSATEDHFIYSGPACLFSGCIVSFENGLVSQWNDFKPIYTDDLKN